MISSSGKYGSDWVTSLYFSAKVAGKMQIWHFERFYPHFFLVGSVALRE